jgi:hypothetical protein
MCVCARVLMRVGLFKRVPASVYSRARGHAHLLVGSYSPVRTRFISQPQTHGKNKISTRRHPLTHAQNHSLKRFHLAPIHTASPMQALHQGSDCQDPPSSKSLRSQPHPRVPRTVTGKAHAARRPPRYWWRHYWQLPEAAGLGAVAVARAAGRPPTPSAAQPLAAALAGQPEAVGLLTAPTDPIHGGVSWGASLTTGSYRRRGRHHRCGW